MANNQNEFYNKNIVITGASSGIGLSAAIYFLNSNANVILVCQDEKSLKKFIKKNNFENAYIIKANLQKKVEIEGLLSFITKIFPLIDIIINCAGIKLDSDIEKTYPEDYDYLININLTSIFQIIRDLRPYFNKGASIINLSCLYGTRPMYGLIAYAMSKAGLETLTRYAAAEFSNLNIRVNAISACPVDTNSLRYVEADNELKYFKYKMKNNIPLGRIAAPHDIVKVIIFLASIRSCKITGQIIKVDGGRSLTSSGYVHYKGIENMNIKVEPDFINIKELIKNFKNEKKLEKPITDQEELKKFIEETVSQSYFSTRHKEAHYSIVRKYNKIGQTDTYLVEKFLKGSIPNEILSLKTGNKNLILSYNSFQNPICDFSKEDKRMIKSQIYKNDYQEDKKNFYFNNIRNNEKNDNFDDINDNKNEEKEINVEENGNPSINKEENEIQKEILIEKSDKEDNLEKEENEDSNIAQKEFHQNDCVEENENENENKKENKKEDIKEEKKENENESEDINEEEKENNDFNGEENEEKEYNDKITNEEKVNEGEEITLNQKIIAFLDKRANEKQNNREEKNENNNYNEEENEENEEKEEKEEKEDNDVNKYDNLNNRANEEGINNNFVQEEHQSENNNNEEYNFFKIEENKNEEEKENINNEEKQNKEFKE